ncbi:uncharacterized protein [Venturia canescens]|uniref:uncharacterized protein n=1 Tax=Venturia canescens TaxID=32260 RepID=UPI001C9C6ECC|nr:uncharacterized protein LOC122407966 [Venturia canescens]
MRMIIYRQMRRGMANAAGKAAVAIRLRELSFGEKTRKFVASLHLKIGRNISAEKMVLRGLFAFLTFLMLQKRMNVSSQSPDVEPVKSLCRQYHRINDTKEISYVEEYYRTQWGSLVLATRVNFRKTVVTRWMVVEMCCEGYEPSQAGDEGPEHCVPVCPSGCPNGVCERPNSCVCGPGYVSSVDNATRMSECLPQCSSGCVGGRCVAPEKCSCEFGYDVSEDSTECKPSCAGVDAGGPEHCGDEGICSAPNVCQCQDGFGPPDWSPPSLWSHATSAEKPSFHHASEINCLPKCMPECASNAFCSAPNECRCEPGYEPASEHECRPVCGQPCHNGFCARPDACECHPGYAPHGIVGSSLCEPVCEEECVNGKCVEPNRCECLSGYGKLSVEAADHASINVSANVCVPNCHEACGNGSCVAPYRCHCNPGYALKHSQWGYSEWQTCQASCDPECDYGLDCIAPNRCSCEPGFELVHGSTCEPSCINVGAGGPENCGDSGTCVAPNTCQCRDGYAPLRWASKLTESTHRPKPVFHSRWDYDCFPDCEQPCPENSACIAPKRCHCSDGYQPNDPHFVTKCSPICEPPCHHGFCERPNVCQCLDGYRANGSVSSNLCEPVCQGGCVNGTCDLPNLCKCFPGYDKLMTRSENLTAFLLADCAPMCFPDCGNGTCVAPNKCDCDPGYVDIVIDYYWDSLKICQPVCNPSCHGELFCAAPDHCQLLDTRAPHLEAFQTRIVEFQSKECGYNGSFAGTSNRTCECGFHSDLGECTEPFLCAIIIVNDTGSAEEFRLLEKIVVLDRTDHVAESYRSAMSCKYECRISIFANESLENIRDETEQCYAINLHDSQTGLVSNVTESLVRIGAAGKTDGSFICFVDASFRCEIPKSEERRAAGVAGAGIIAGGVFLVAIFLALALSIYLSRRKMHKLFGGLRQKDETMMERSEATDSPHILSFEMWCCMSCSNPNMALRGLSVIVTLLFLQRRISVLSQTPDPRPAKSLCRQYHRVNFTTMVTFMEDVYDDYAYYDPHMIIPLPKNRLASRIETHTKWSVVEMCCEGYEPSPDEQSPEHCIPVCPSGCHNGVCERPNSCLCDPGYVAYVDNVTRLSECLSHCESGCVGGRCVAPETCSCNRGYQLSEDSASCKPICNAMWRYGEDGCGHGGSCVAPDLCQCRDGYALREKYLRELSPSMREMEKPTFPQASLIDCDPLCESKCPDNSTCTQPDVCDCDSGYEPHYSNGWLKKCLPICQQACHNGFCVQPNECQCHEGYKEHESLGSVVCEAACEGNCVNGKCVSPNRCECLSGYEKLVVRSANQTEDSSNVCIPICQGGCGNGTCVAPDKCHCNPGYRVPESAHNSSKTCRPTCSPGCNDESVCVAPNHCQLRDTAVAEYPSYRTRIVHFSSKECGQSGFSSEANGNCTCRYRSDRSDCVEQLHCAVILVEETKSVEEFRLLEKLVFHEQTTEKLQIYDSNVACRNECRISIFSNETLEDDAADVERCFAINLHDAKTGVLFNAAENLVPISGKVTNESFICFVKAGFRCNVPKHGEKGTGGIVGTGVIAGAICLVTIIFAFALSIFFTRRKIWKRFESSSRKNETTMERSKATDSPFCTDEASHL